MAESNGMLLACERLPFEQLMLLRRQMVLLKSSEASKNYERREHPRQWMSEVVEVVGIRNDGALDLGAKFESFCKDVSDGGCSLLHHRMLNVDKLVVRFRTNDHRQINLVGKPIRNRRILFDIYEIGICFEDEVNVEGKSVLLHAGHTVSRRLRPRTSGPADDLE